MNVNACVCATVATDMETGEKQKLQAFTVTLLVFRFECRDSLEFQ